VPELPEVQTIVNELNQKIVGKKIAKIEIKVAKMFTGNPKFLIGKKIITIKRISKLIITGFTGKLYLFTHLKMTGQLIFIPKGKPDIDTAKSKAVWTHIIIHFSDDSRLLFNDVRKFGWMKAVDKSGLDKILTKEKYGLDPLSYDFTLNNFKKVLQAKPKLLIKPALMDQKIIAGIGNIYADEILFQARIHPKRMISDLSEKEISNLFLAIRVILKKAIRYKGASVDNYRRTAGDVGTYNLHRLVYQKTGEKCSRCAGVIERIKFRGRSAHFCPKCQK
jgi:formamidopyrimidine-DNA glycosylase